MSSIALKPFDVQSSVGYHSQPLFVLGCGRAEQSYEAAGVATMGGAFGVRAGSAYFARYAYFSP